jgi:hypothetical protein
MKSAEIHAARANRSARVALALLIRARSLTGEPLECAYSSPFRSVPIDD